MLHNQKGFTLIELMLVIGILGILAMFALPAYQDYIKRARVIEGIQLMDEIKVDVHNYYVKNDKYPKSFSVLGINAQKDPIEQREYITMAPPLRLVRMYSNDNDERMELHLYYDKTVVPELGYKDQLYIVARNYKGSLKWDCVRDEEESKALPKKITPPQCIKKITEN